MDIGSMDIKDIDEMTYQAIWEYKRGKNIRENDINIAIEKRKRCMDDIEQIFKDYDFLALPSAQVFPFKKELNYPYYIYINYFLTKTENKIHLFPEKNDLSI